MQNTTNYNLNKPDGNDYAKIESLNENADIIDGKLKELEDNTGTVDSRITTHLAENAVGAHKAKNIALEDVDGLFVGTEVETAMKELFISVSNGKQLIGTAITDVDDSLVVPTNPTHAQLADLIRLISTGKKWASGTTTSTDTSPLVYLHVSGLNFKPRTIIIPSATENSYVYSTIYSADIHENQFLYGQANAWLDASNYVRESEFRLKVASRQANYNWIAME